MTYSDDDLARELRRELQGNLVPFDPARAQHMIDEAIAASPVRQVLRSRWALPVLASGAVAAVVGGVAGAAALQPDSKPAHPGGGPTVAVRPSPPPTATPPQCEPVSTVTPTVPSSPQIPAGPAVTLPSKGDTCVLVVPTSMPGGSTSPTVPSANPSPMTSEPTANPSPTVPPVEPTTSVPTGTHSP